MLPWLHFGDMMVRYTAGISPARRLVPEKVSFAETKQEITDKSNGDMKLPSDGKTVFPPPRCLQRAPDTYTAIKTNRRAQVCVYTCTTTRDLPSPVSRAEGGWMAWLHSTAAPV